MKLVFKKLKIFSTHFLHFVRGIGPIEMELKHMEHQYIKNLGNWKQETQYESYLDNTPINIMKVMEGASENQKVQYNPRNVPKPPEELQRIIFSFIERCKISLNAIYASDPSQTACALLDFTERVRTVLLQDVAQLMNIGRTHIFFIIKFSRLNYY